MTKEKFLRGTLVLTAFLVLMGCQQSPQAVITFGGDVMLARDGSPLFTQGNPWGDAGTYLSEIHDQNPTAYFLVNLESPLSTLQATPLGQGYNLCAEAGQISTLVTGGVSLVSLANNHQDDCGGKGTGASREILDSESIRSTGGDYLPTYFTADGLRVGVIAAEDVSQPVDRELLMQSIREARANCDFVIVSIHWGNEYQAGANERQKGLAQEIADAGADIIWGHHPHVLQPMVWLESCQGTHRTLVMYSLGNLLTDQGMNADVQETALVSVTVRAGEIKEIEVLPLEKDPVGKFLFHAGESESKKILDRLQVSMLTGVNVVVK